MPKRKGTEFDFSFRTSQKRIKTVVDSIGLTEDLFVSSSSSDEQNETDFTFSDNGTDMNDNCC